MKVPFQGKLEMKRKLTLFQYGSNQLMGSDLMSTEPTLYSATDWVEISISESSPSERSCSIGIPQVSNSSASEASTGVRNELASSSPQDLSENFYEISRFFQGRIEEIGADLPSNWSLEDFTRMVIGEEEVLDPSYLSDVYSNLLECGFHSCYWEQAFDYIALIYGL